MTVTDEWVVAAPGLVEGMPDGVYHADPVPDGSLSSTGARKILPPGCPALFRYEQKFGRPDKPSFDYGHAAHAKVLGVGMPTRVIPDDILASNGATSTKEAKAFVAEARAAGAVPLKSDEAAQIEAMAAALREHPLAATLLKPDAGRPEVSGFWVDPRNDVWCRLRFDWLPDPREDGRLIIPDYKTAASADPDEFARSAANFGYPQQHAFYTDGARAMALADDIAFVFVVQMKTPPYLVTVCELHPDDVRLGRNRNLRALDLYAHCKRNDDWPAHVADDEVAQVKLPRWYEYREDRQS